MKIALNRTVRSELNVRRDMIIAHILPKHGVLPPKEVIEIMRVEDEIPYSTFLEEFNKVN